MTLIAQIKITAFHYAVLGMFLAAATSAIAGGLAFADSARSIKDSKEQRYVTIQFECRNSSDTLIKLIGGTVGCGCTSYSFSRATVPPRNSCTVTMVVDMQGKSRVGRITETMIVLTDEADRGNYHLIANIECAEALVVEPTILMWKVNEEANPKTSTLLLSREASVALGKLPPESFVASDGRFQVTAQLGEGRAYLIRVTPASTKVPFQAIVHGKPGSPLHRFGVPEIYVYVSP